MFSFAYKHVLIVSRARKRCASKHHYAEALVHHKAKVTFLEPYDPEAPAVRKTETITVVNGFKPTPGLRFLPRFLRIHLALRDAKRLLAVTGAVDVVWSFDNSRLFDLDVFEDAYLIHHCMDANMDFQLARTVRHAHVNLAVTDEIAERMAKARWRYRLVSNVCKVPHGWAGYKTGQIEVPAASGKRAFYAGNLAIGYIHWDWLLSLIGAHSEVEFVFAGMPILKVRARNSRLRPQPELRDCRPHPTSLYWAASRRATCPIGMRLPMCCCWSTILSAGVRRSTTPTNSPNIWPAARLWWPRGPKRLKRTTSCPWPKRWRNCTPISWKHSS